MLARRGHPRRHCNEEGFGTLSRQFGNDEGYRSSCAGVSGCSSPPTPAQASTHGRARHRVLTGDLLDHLVGGRQQRFRDGEAECLGSLEVDRELELGGLLNRQVARLFALEDAADIGALGEAKIRV